MDAVRLWWPPVRWAGYTLLWLAPAVVFVGAAVDAVVEDHQILNHGGLVQALVTSAEDNRNTETVTLAYATPDGARHTAELDIDGSGVAPGQRIALRYDPGDPEDVRAPGRSDLGVEYVVVGAFAVVPLIGLVWTARFTAGLLRRRRAVRRTGWTKARAVVGEPALRGRRWSPSRAYRRVIDVESASGDFRVYLPYLSIRAPRVPLGSRIDALVGGTGRSSVVVLLPPGHRPWIVPWRPDRE